MDFSYSDVDTALDELAGQVFTPQAAKLDRKRAAEDEAMSGGPGIDHALWVTLGETGLIAAFADAASASTVGAALVCRRHGESVAAVPMWQTIAALLGLGPEVGNASVAAARDAVIGGDGWATVALPELGGSAPRSAPIQAADGRLSGEIPLVSAVVGAAWCLIPAVSACESAALYWVDLAGTGVTITPSATTDRRSAGTVHLDTAAGVRLGGADAVARTRQLADTLLAATQAGVCAAAIRSTAEYLGVRHQFGRPLSSFQAPVHRLVDSYIDTDAIWLTTLLAAWQLDQGLDAASAVDVAKWWAADAGTRAVHTTQHLHGGIGSDVDYPIHRYFLWAKTIGDLLGGAAAHAAHLGDLLAAQ